MALAAAVLPPAAQDALRRRLTHQPARASQATQTVPKLTTTR
jgi:hypothetical protein